MTVYVQVPYFGTVQVTEQLHEELRRHIYHRIITQWRKLASKVYEMNAIEGKVPKTSFMEWLYLAYQQRKYWIYKRLQIVKILYQPESKYSSKSPYPFADVRAWIYKKYEGEWADEEIEEGTYFDVSDEVAMIGTGDTTTLQELDKETDYLLGVFPSIACAFYHGSVTEITVATEVEIVDEDEVEDIEVMHRGVIIYRFNIDLSMAWRIGGAIEQKMAVEMGVELHPRVGVYKDKQIENLERLLWETYCRNVGKVDFSTFKNWVLENVYNGEWLALVSLHNLAGFSCRIQQWWFE